MELRESILSINRNKINTINDIIELILKEHEYDTKSFNEPVL